MIRFKQFTVQGRSMREWLTVINKAGESNFRQNLQTIYRQVCKVCHEDLEINLVNSELFLVVSIWCHFNICSYGQGGNLVTEIKIQLQLKLSNLIQVLNVFMIEKLQCLKISSLYFYSNLAFGKFFNSISILLTQHVYYFMYSQLTYIFPEFLKSLYSFSNYPLNRNQLHKY